MDDEVAGERRILVAEDDPGIRRLVEWALQDEGYLVDVVDSGTAAIRYLTEQEPVMVVLDIMMPGADGFAVAEVLRSLHGYDTPVLVLTAAGDARRVAERISADGYLAKPFDLSDLTASVHRLVDHAGVGAHGRAQRSAVGS